MKLEERIEAAAKRVVKVTKLSHDINGTGLTRVEEAAVIIRAAFPELFTDPPTAWIAPFEATDEMKRSTFDGADADLAYAMMREAHLRAHLSKEEG